MAQTPICSIPLVHGAKWQCYHKVGSWFIPDIAAPGPSDITYHFTGCKILPSPPPTQTKRDDIAIAYILVFTDVADPPDEACEYCPKVGMRQWLNPVARLMYYRPKATFTLVDALPTMFGVERVDDIVARLQEEATNPFYDGKEDRELLLEALTTLPERVTLFSGDEYRERVGDNTYALEMDWDSA